MNDARIADARIADLEASHREDVERAVREERERWCETLGIIGGPAPKVGG